VLLGLHLLFERFAWLQTAIRMAGGAYLVYLGLMMLKASFGPAELPETSTTTGPRSDAAAFSSGLLTNLSNPKALVYFGSIFATLLPVSISIPAKMAVFALVTAESLLWFSVLAVLFSLPVPRRAYQRANRWIDRIAGVAFGGFGLRLLFSGRH
jgi:threonine efflux protein